MWFECGILNISGGESARELYLLNLRDARIYVN